MWIAVSYHCRRIPAELERSAATFFRTLTAPDRCVTPRAIGCESRRIDRADHPRSFMTDALIHALTAGEAALEAGDLDAAVTHFAEAAAAAPREVSLGLALAHVHKLRADPLSQQQVLRAVYGAGDWQASGVAHSLGGALLDAGLPEEAASCFTHVLSQLPRDPAALAALAAATRALGDPQAAWPLAKQALSIAPNNSAFLLTAAQVRHDQGDLIGALNYLDKAERARPGHGPTRVQRSYTLLLRAPSADGWMNFEHRPLPVPVYDSARWNGEPLNGRSLLVTAEQGIGDQFQFLRFVSRLVAFGASRVTVECHPHLLELLRGNAFDAVERGRAPATDLHVPLLSLPHVLRLGANVDGVSVPYIAPVGEAGIAVPPRDGRARIGLVWAGNPAFAGRVTRDFDISLLPELVTGANVRWISLQQGDAADHVPDGVHRLQPLTSWSQTAALLAELDGVVTTDTGIAHLAGAMGVPGWVMLQKIPDWRWGLRGNSTPWYPSLTLVRQSAPRDWKSVVRALHQALPSHLASIYEDR